MAITMPRTNGKFAEFLEETRKGRGLSVDAFAERLADLMPRDDGRDHSAFDSAVRRLRRWYSGTRPRQSTWPAVATLCGVELKDIRGLFSGGDSAHHRDTMTEFKPEMFWKLSSNMGGTADTVSGLWYLFFIIPDATNELLWGGVAFFKNNKREYCEGILMEQDRQWRIRVFTTDAHMYFLFRDSPKVSESAFMISNRPNLTDEVVAGSLLSLARPQDAPMATVRPVTTTLCFGEKKDIDFIIEQIANAGGGPRGRIASAIHKALTLENLTRRERNLIRLAERRYVPEQIGKFQQDFPKSWRYLSSLQINGSRISNSRKLSELALLSYLTWP